ncbi:MAG: hypothetical protein M5T52_00405 [Ignavibacteriaceae bacterium]|nr:hypothetical protein [Ignavibacteriaceae bacterium]
MKYFVVILLFAFCSFSIAQEMDSSKVEKDSVIVEQETQPEAYHPHHQDRANGIMEELLGLIFGRTTFI